jgi:hypothetical protein
MAFLMSKKTVTTSTTAQLVMDLSEINGANDLTFQNIGTSDVFILTDSASNGTDANCTNKLYAGGSIKYPDNVGSKFYLTAASGIPIVKITWK